MSAKLLGCALIAACSYPPLPTPGNGPVVLPDADSADLSPICPSIALGTPLFHASACANPTSAVRVTTSTSFNTDDGTSTVNGLSCMRVANETSEVCVLVGSSIVIDPGVAVSAHGSLPFALFAHSMMIRGTVDVASHLGGQIGAGSLTAGCIPGTLATGAGGGRGGDGPDRGGKGGDDSNTAMTGATGGGTFSFNDIRGGGCGGTRGSDASSSSAGTDNGNASGGAGGGVVWIVSLNSELVIDAGAKINASGAGGVGGKDGIRGGAGGGAGGLIVLQAPSIQLNAAAAVFANGGHGGGGSGIQINPSTVNPGVDGTDPDGPTSGGGGGTGGPGGFSGSVPGGGGGGSGFPFTARDGQSGATGGGGGGGGGPGAIRVVSATDITGTNVSPPPVLLK